MLHQTDYSRRQALAVCGLGSLALTVPGILRAEPDSVPEVLATNLVRASPTTWDERPCLAVELIDAEQTRALADAGGNPPSYAIVHRDFTNGVVEVDVAGVLTGKGGPDARGFVGLAFHIDAEANTYEAIYLRMTNGGLNPVPPPAPRIDRAIQYVAHPGFHFSDSRAAFPGRYERGADIAVGRWHRFRLEIEPSRVRALVDGQEALTVEDPRYAGRRGAVGLWVGDGSRGYFRQLRVHDA